jgi:hypothetical protein
MTNALQTKNFEQICHDLQFHLGELADLGAVMATIIGGAGIENAPGEDGYVRLTAKEARAISWTGLEIADRTNAVFEDFVNDYGAAIKSSLLARSEVP